MHIDQARALERALSEAIIHAEINGLTEVDLIGSLSDAAKAASAELQAAINAADPHA